MTLAAAGAGDVRGVGVEVAANDAFGGDADARAKGAEENAAGGEGGTAAVTDGGAGNGCATARPGFLPLRLFLCLPPLDELFLLVNERKMSANACARARYRVVRESAYPDSTHRHRHTQSGYMETHMGTVFNSGTSKYIYTHTYICIYLYEVQVDVKQET